MSMNNFGFIRVAAATMATKVAYPGYNSGQAISKLVEEAHSKGVSILAFPELCVSGYSCGDLFCQSLLLRKCEEEVAALAELSFEKNMAIVVGVPVQHNGRLYNCAAVLKDGEVKGLVPKTYIPNHGEYCESRWFASGSDLIHGPEIIYAGFSCIISPNQIFEIGETSFAVEIGEDLMNPIAPSSYHALSGAQIIVNLSAGNDVVMRGIQRERSLGDISSRIRGAYIYASASGDSSQDLVFTGHASVWENGEKMAEYTDGNPDGLAIADIDVEKINTMRRKTSTFSSISPDGTPSSAYDLLYNRIYLGEENPVAASEKLYRYVERHPFVPAKDLDYRCRTILDLQVKALCSRLDRIKSKAVIGISGGLDSTLALIVTALAFDRLRKNEEATQGLSERWARQNIIAVTMPGFGTTSRTKNNAWDLMEALGVTCREISIVPACEQHFKDISHDPAIHDATYENTQARERTQILMDIANQVGGIVVGTGDLSELALGWATYNGDHMSMYGVNADIPKTLVRSLVEWAAENRFKGVAACGKDSTGKDERCVRDILMDIVDTPISPELLPAAEDGKIKQVTEDLVGPYELHDFFLYSFIRCGYSPEKIFFLAQKAFGEGALSSDDSTKGESYDDQTIKKWLKTFIRRFFNQQFKRSCLPDGPKIGSVSLSPRGDWHMVSDAWSDDFLAEL